ncbi:MAG: alkaline phosphatase family protein [Acidobacteria bacterium]|nr:alkaline phosphatase family protein [Acidobacteriota bacterium]MBI3262672.1 alkaline phosphatase family protein [Acidobacteriota bacterium]
MRRRALSLVLLVLVLPSATARTQPSRAADHVIVIMLDGARTDVLHAADAPNIKSLERAGTTFAQARTVYPSQTRVAFVSLPTGAYPASHGIVGGTDFRDASWQSIPLGDAATPERQQVLCMRPTIFEELKAAGLTSLYAAMKGYELVGARGATWTINGGKIFDPRAWESRYEPQASGSARLAFWYKLQLSRRLLDEALPLMRQHRPNFVILNLGSADYTAHSFGPETPEYRLTIEFLDALVGELVKTIDDLGLRPRTTFVLSADHGFSQVHPTVVIAPFANPTVQPLVDRGIENFVSDTGGTSMGVYLRDKSRVKEAVDILRQQWWSEAVYCEDREARCDRSLSDLKALFPGRSPDLMVDLDNDASLSRSRPGAHGSLRSQDMEIPLIFSGAGIVRGVRSKASLVDIAPTALKLLGLQPTLLRPDGHVLDEVFR